MVDTGRIGDDQRRAVVSFGFFNGLEDLVVIGSHGDLSDIDVAIGHCHRSEVFLADALAGRREFGDGADRGALRRLSAGVRIDFGVENQDVYVLARCDDVVQTAESDVVGPAVAADDPDRLFDQVVFQFEDLLADRAVAGFHHRDQAFGDLFAFGRVLAVVDPFGHYAFQFGRAGRSVFDRFAHQDAKALALFGDARQDPESEFGVVLEQRVSPGRPETFVVGAVRGRRCGASVVCALAMFIVGSCVFKKSQDKFIFYI